MTGWGIAGPKGTPLQGFALPKDCACPSGFSESHSGQSLVASLLQIGSATGAGMTRGTERASEEAGGGAWFLGLCRLPPLGPGLHWVAVFPAPHWAGGSGYGI